MGLVAELFKSIGLLGGLVLGANFHGWLAAQFMGLLNQTPDVVRAFIPDTFFTVFAYALMVIGIMWLARLLHQLLVIKLMKREAPTTFVERWGGAILGVGRGLLGIGMLLLLAQTIPWGNVAEYLTVSVRERSYSGRIVVDQSRAVIERAADAVPGHTLRSSLFPLAS